nr:hypothetical protein [Pandoraea faecigallinarum]
MEYALLRDLISRADISVDRKNYLIDSMGDVSVEEMLDGGMGSLRLINKNARNRKFGGQLVESEYVDMDGVQISVAVNVDQFGDLFELDIWKVDFSALIKFPSP